MVRCPNCGAVWEIFLRRTNKTDLFKSRESVIQRHQQITRLHDLGYSLSEIGLKLGVTKQCVWQHVNHVCQCQRHIDQRALVGAAF